MTRLRLMGQGGHLVNCAVSDEKLRAVFALFDADAKTEIAWYVFASNTDAATQRACTAKFPGAAYGDWGFRSSLGTFIPLGRDIPLDGLAEPWPKGSAAQLDLDLSGALIQCDISQLQTKAKTKTKTKGTVAFTFTLEKTHQGPPIPSGQSRSKPSYKGKVYFLESATFSDEKAFKNNLINGPQANSSKILIDGPVM